MEETRNKEDQLIKSILESLEEIKEMIRSRKRTFEKEVYTSEEVSKIFGIHLNTLSKWRSKGAIAYHKVGRRLFYKGETLEAMLQNKQVVR